jgi:small subunit ribosomal protein S6
MPLYEHVFLVRQDASVQQVEALSTQFKSVIESNGGKVSKTEHWGLRSIAFRIRKNRKAHYVLLNIDAPAPALTEMERQMSINEDIIRFLTVRVAELEDGPSAIVRQSKARDRDDDRGFGGFGDRGFGGFGVERTARRSERGERSYRERARTPRTEEETEGPASGQEAS